MSAAPRISLVIPTLGRLATLPRVLGRLDEQTAAAEQFEVVVVADAAVEEPSALERLLQERRYSARLLRAARPGASAARNAGWRAAQAPLILFIDDDVLPRPELVAEHLGWHDRHPAREIGVLGHVRWAPELRVTPFMRWLEHGIQFNYPSISGEETVWGNFYTANVSVKRELVERAGGFDEQRLPFGYEDLDLALRMHRGDGFRLLYNRAAEADHVHRMDVEFWRRRVPRIAAAERQFVALHPEVPAYFHDLFADAAGRPAVGAWIEGVARLVPRRLPLAGPYVWWHLDLFYRQGLAGPFLDAWRGAPGDPGQPLEPSVSASSGGAPPGGPK